MFVDLAKIYVEAGSGGNGAVSFHLEKYVAAGGPDGGDGGNGGNVVFKADKQLATLMDFRYKKKYKAEPGENGKSANRKGRNGENIVIKVPCGTILRDVASGKIIADLTDDGDEFIAAKGGSGGFGNARFATPTRQIPRFAKPGLKGQALELQLELKLLADVGLLGFPNVGKSTILSMVSDAAPKIANYHFTTLQPNLGVVKMGEGESFVIADIPGLIEGAHEGVGLGHAFLRHVERTRILIHVVDVSGIEGRNPVEDFDAINAELVNYKVALADRLQVVAANKTDIATPEQVAEFRAEMESRGYTVFEISAATNTGLKELINSVYTMLKDIPVPEIHEIEVLAEDEAESLPFEVRKENEKYVVEGGYIEYLIDSTNFDDDESLKFFQDALKRKGIVAALEEAGIEEGDTVKMYDLEFEFVF
ncbi:MAG: GTPase ObgE [Clostridia bacterium]|nr:GTPase ObgE [Clostridia bacterium]